MVREPFGENLKAIAVLREILQSRSKKNMLSIGRKFVSYLCFCLKKCVAYEPNNKVGQRQKWGYLVQFTDDGII